MSDRPPPYRFRWADYWPRLVFGNFVAICAIGVFAALDMMPFWLVYIPCAIHVIFLFMAWRGDFQKPRSRDHDS